jgi:hypothetical protein
MELKHFVPREISEEALSVKSPGQSGLFKGNSLGRSKILSECYVNVLTLRR